jgi:O-antigen/teichoic acid export membrane protein
MQANNSRIAKNTLMLYIRQIIILFVNLYSVRILLNALGVSDYGVYGVVGGVVSFFSFLSGTMASATQRFFSFALGEKNFDKLKKIFSVNWLTYTGIAIIAFILLETAGLWFVKHRLDIPHGRQAAVFWVYHFSVLTFITTIFSTPFMAIIIAHEDMRTYAFISVLDAVMKLGVVLLLVYLPGDKLELYGLFLFLESFIVAAVYVITTTKKYEECQFRKIYWDKSVLKEILSFTGWTLFGQCSLVARNEAILILLNQMFNPIVVAARTIATNITTQATVFSNNFNVGLYPPIIKYYAADKKDEMYSLIFNGSKITFFLVWIFALPMFFEMNTLLTVWLGKPPGDTVLFTRLALVEVIITSTALPLTTAARAPGKVKKYELSLSALQMGIFFFSWMALALGSPVYAIYVVAIIINILMFILRLVLVKVIGLPIRMFCKKVVLPALIIAVLSTVATFIVHDLLPTGFFYSCISICSSMLFSSVCMYYIGIDESLRQKALKMVKDKIQNFKYALQKI